VFAAASERNTVKEHPCEPKPFMFPATEVKFGTLSHVPPCSDYSLRHRGGKTGPGGNHFPPAVADGSVSGPIRGPWTDYVGGASRRKPRPIKVRGRVGRGGRIFLDRVVFEPERGVKAASYPASVEMGGVYTAGLPLEAAERVAAEGFGHGLLGNVEYLGLGHSSSGTEHAFIQPLAPMVKLSEGTVNADGQTVYWPSTKKRKPASIPTSTMSKRRREVSRQAMASDNIGPRRRSSNEESLRRIPAYAPREVPLVQPA
jgi:hypothetical protein